MNIYRLLSAKNDVKALAKGPKATAKRYVRKTVYRNTNQATRKILRKIGL